jgi:hypothetical protein
VTLCSKPESGIDRSAAKLLTGILNAQVDSKAALCVIDSAIVGSQHECLAGAGARSAFTMADLMIRLAYNWRQQGALDRANELAQQANVLLQAVGEDKLQRMSALRAWALVEMERGQLQHAAQLADLQTTLARRWYQTVPNSRAPLIEALELKGLIFEKLGLSNDAQTAREEAEKLKSK